MFLAKTEPIFYFFFISAMIEYLHKYTINPNTTTDFEQYKHTKSPFLSPFHRFHTSHYSFLQDP